MHPPCGWRGAEHERLDLEEGDLVQEEGEGGRRPRRVRPAEAVAPEEGAFVLPQAEGRKAEKPAKEPKAAKESIWKKDLSLGKKKTSEVDRLAEQAALAIESVSLPFEPASVPQPVELAEAYVAAMPDPEPPAPEPVALAVVPAEPVELPPVELPPVEVAPIELTSVELPPVELPSVELPPVELPPSVELPPDLHEVAPLPVAEVPAAVEAESWPEPEPVLAPVVEQPAEPWLAEAALPPEPLPEVAAVTVHPPVPAAELPPLPAEAAKTPFWKKDLSVSRKPKAEKAAKAPKAAREPKDKSAPFWKKELSLGRKPKAAPAEAATEQLPAAPKTPMLKKQLSLPKLSLPKLPTRAAAAADTARRRSSASRLARRSSRPHGSPTTALPSSSSSCASRLPTALSWPASCATQRRSAPR